MPWPERAPPLQPRPSARVRTSQHQYLQDGIPDRPHGHAPGSHGWRGSRLKSLQSHLPPRRHESRDHPPSSRAPRCRPNRTRVQAVRSFRGQPHALSFYCKLVLLQARGMICKLCDGRHVMEYGVARYEGEKTMGSGHECIPLVDDREILVPVEPLRPPIGRGKRLPFRRGRMVAVGAASIRITFPGIGKGWAVGYVWCSNGQSSRWLVWNGIILCHLKECIFSMASVTSMQSISASASKLLRALQPEPVKCLESRRNSFCHTIKQLTDDLHPEMSIPVLH